MLFVLANFCWIFNHFSTKSVIVLLSKWGSDFRELKINTHVTQWQYMKMAQSEKCKKQLSL